MVTKILFFIDNYYLLYFSFIKDGSTFLKILAMGAVQFCGFVKTSKLPPLSPNLSLPKPPVDEDDKEATLSLAAGMCDCHVCILFY